MLRHPDKTLIRTYAEVSEGYEGFKIVDCRREIDAKFSRRGLVVKIREDDFLAWGVRAWLRHESRHLAPLLPFARRRADHEVALRPAPSVQKLAIRDTILAHGRRLAETLGGGSARFTGDDDANKLLYVDPFAFLAAVICDQGIRAERAWAIPHELAQRLGTLDPVQPSEPSRARRACRC